MHTVTIVQDVHVRKKSYKDVWRREWKEYCNDGWMFLNKRPPMMCWAKKNKKNKKSNLVFYAQSTITVISRRVMKGVGLLFSLGFPPTLLCLKSSRRKYHASIFGYLFFLHFDVKMFRVTRPCLRCLLQSLLYLVCKSLRLTRVHSLCCI